MAKYLEHELRELDQMPNKSQFICDRKTVQETERKHKCV